MFENLCGSCILLFFVFLHCDAKNSCWVVRHNVHSQQHTNVSSSYRSSRLGLSHWDPYAVRRGG